MRLIWPLFLLLVLTASCKKAYKEDLAWVNALVEETRDINCGLPRLDFSEDSSKIRAITGEKSQVRFIAKGLPVEFTTEGKKLRVLVRKLRPEESFACLTLGPNYPGIMIVKAEAR